MSRLKDSERTKLIAEFIRTGKSPAGYEITVNESSKYKVRRIKSKQEQLEAKKERLLKQLADVEVSLSNLVQASQENNNSNISCEEDKSEDNSNSDKEEA